MARTILCIAPHPDDETLGCGGTLLRHIAEGDAVHWLIVTEISEAIGFAAERVASRAAEIEAVAKAYGFAGVHQCALPSMRLETLPLLDVIGAVGRAVSAIEASVLYVPYRNDAHSDHAVVYDAAVACAKTFRYPYVRSVYAYETVSETEFGMKPEDPGFRPNLFVDIEAHLDQKISIMEMFEGEMGAFPFPRSETCMRALAQLRGSQSSRMAAEAFMIIKEIR
ncbi:PIG-L family deacetylase [Sphingomonas sp. R-74633]|uniref:PIG-L deacetylase family protein n=1 Tax=Sphingomonas sp. R-74633 TaxID=2751188 RepID=UPI0015D2FA4A|nr:PIG-L deacetylase family protein [Sphingomonas sp. R-74633]NYT39219.1 PIG-L family deacetylase [Sphingomonas sp. R-74633]